MLLMDLIFENSPTNIFDTMNDVEYTVDNNIADVHYSDMY